MNINMLRLILLTALLIIGCEHRAQSPTDSGPRIAALSPAIARTLVDLGHESKIVARHDYDAFSAHDAPPAGHQEAIDYETLIRVKPTHVLVQWGMRPLPPRLTELAEANGWQVHNMAMLSLDEIGISADTLQELFGADPESWLIEDNTPPSAVFERALAPRPGAFEGPVLLLAGLDPPSAVGPGSFHHQILCRLGGTPAMTEGAAWQELDAERILRMAPAAIILIAPGSDSDGPTADHLGRIGALPIPAVKSGRLATITEPLANLPSTSLARFAEILGDQLVAWGETAPEDDEADEAGTGTP